MITRSSDLFTDSYKQQTLQNLLYRVYTKIIRGPRHALYVKSHENFLLWPGAI